LTGYPPEEARKALGGPSSEATDAHFTAVFSDLACDILALQEGVTHPQIQRIARAMGRYAATFPSPMAWPGHLLTRYSIAESRVYSHMTPDAAVPPLSRTAGAALLTVSETRQLWVVNIHLHPSRIELRNTEADRMGDLLAALSRSPHPVVVLGDFNCEVEERMHAVLQGLGFVNAMAAAGGGLQPTMDTAGVKGQWSLDHIYLSADLKDRLTGAEVIRRPGYRDDGPPREGRWVHSDHLPVVATVDYP
jgi:endonuclease/exonuclease/phosphatase family metal-dependent hydrolase